MAYIARIIRFPFKTIVVKGVVSEGTCERIKKILNRALLEKGCTNPGEVFDLLYIPMSSENSSTFYRLKNPGKIIVGTDKPGKGSETLLKLYENFLCPKVITSFKAAESIGIKEEINK